MHNDKDNDSQTSNVVSLRQVKLDLAVAGEGVLPALDVPAFREVHAENNRRHLEALARHANEALPLQSSQPSAAAVAWQAWVDAEALDPIIGVPITLGGQRRTIRELCKTYQGSAGNLGSAERDIRAYCAQKWPGGFTPQERVEYIDFVMDVGSDRIVKAYEKAGVRNWLRAIAPYARRRDVGSEPVDRTTFSTEPTLLWFRLTPLRSST